MKTDHKESNEKNNFWVGDILKREDAAKYLESYLTKRYQLKKDEDGFVLAVNAEWGYGKTFMLERWQKELAFKNHPVVYFDAWKNDFTSEPLIAFISELDTGLTDFFKHVPTGKKLYTTAYNQLKKIVKPASRVLLAAGAKHIVGLSSEKMVEIFNDNEDDESSDDDGKKEGKEKPFDSVKKSLANAVDNALKEHKNTKTAIKEFKEKLEQLIEALDKSDNIQLPIFIFIDELDRCRPNYAIELLESIKHLFGVKGIYFIVATNMAQLSESIKAVYGAGFDGERYLKRFFDLEYSLPEPSNFDFAKSLFRGSIKPHPSKIMVGISPINGIYEQGEIFEFIFSQFATYFKATPRDQKQVIKILEAAFLNLESEKIHINLLFFLTFLFQRSSTIFKSIIDSGVTSGIEYDKLNLQRYAGALEHRERTPHGTQETRKTSIQEIGDFYLRIRLLNTSGSFQNLTQQGFPNSLISHFSISSNGSENSWQIEVNRYIEIVRQAGAFTEKI